VVTLQAAPGFAGARCAGAAARLVGRISREQLEQAIAEEYEALGKPVMAQNLEQALGAFDAAAPHAGMVREGEPVSASNYASPEWIDLLLEAARAAAPDVFAAATSLEVRTGLWRTMRPEIDYARCKRCVWVCSTLCPDSAIRVRADGAPEIDYDHCKGCMICVAVCPPHAIAALPERASVA
jgi:pyruvate ferredoxin oxidoreductase gamma subunit